MHAVTTRQQLAVFLIVLSLISFPLHWVWEWVQCKPFFVHGLSPPTPTAMLRATLGDVLLTLLAYGAVSVVHGASWPLRPWSPGVWLILLGMALVMSIGFEIYALNTGRWAYTDAAPRLPGTPISALPVAQLLILFPLNFYLAGRFVRRKQPENPWPGL